MVFWSVVLGASRPGANGPRIGAWVRSDWKLHLLLQPLNWSQVSGSAMNQPTGRFLLLASASAAAAFCLIGAPARAAALTPCPDSDRLEAPCERPQPPCLPVEAPCNR